MKPTYLIWILVLLCSIGSAQQKPLMAKVPVVEKSLVVSITLAKQQVDYFPKYAFVYRTRGKRVQRALFFETKRNRKLV